MVDFIVISYNRPAYLTATINAIRLRCGLPHKIIIADNDSDQLTVDTIKILMPDSYVKTSRIFGLGGNINSGIDAAIGNYHFILQDDFVVKYDITEWLEKAIKVLDSNSKIDIIRFGTPYDAIRFYPEHYSPDRKLRLNGMNVVEQDNLIIVNAIHPETWIYSDNPHIRRNTFTDKFGYYIEGFDPPTTETNMRDKFNLLNGKTAWFKHFENTPPFDHIGENSMRNKSEVING